MPIFAANGRLRRKEGAVLAVLKVRGFEIHKNLLDPAQQIALVDQVRNLLKIAPLFRPMTPYGKPMSVEMTSAGSSRFL